MKLHNFEAHIDPKILQRGFEYYDEEHVEKIEQIDKGEFTAKITGSQYYTVFVKLRGDDVTSWGCSCPYDWGDVCKHVVAALYCIRDGKLYEEKPNGKADAWLALLKAITPGKLRDYVFEKMKRDPKFRNEFLKEFGINVEEDDEDGEYDEDYY